MEKKIFVYEIFYIFAALLGKRRKDFQKKNLVIKKK